MHAHALLLTTLLLLTSALAATTTSTTTGLSPAQYSSLSSVIEKDFSSYYSSVTANPSVASLAAVVAAELGTSRAASVNLLPTHSLDYLSWATAASAAMTVLETSWETALPSSLRSQYYELQTSMFFAEASIIRKDAKISGAQGAPGVGLLWGSAVVMAAFGVGAVLL